MKALLISIFGEYVPQTYEAIVPVYNSALEDVEEITYDVIPNGLAGIDWPFVLGVVTFIVSLYCVLRIIGAVINRV